jgi:hypothetical protein
VSWTLIGLGKYRDKTLPQVLFSDPDWFFWAMEEGVIKAPPLRSEAALLFHRATHIRVPQSGDEPVLVEHYIHRPTMKYSHFDVVPADRDPHAGASPIIRADVIDLRVPRMLAGYDKTGYKGMLSSLKYYYFGSKSARMTRERCEAFYSATGNFL